MKIGIMQPYFFPYIGYWQLIHAIDLFVVGDSVHYIKHGWINRNRILGEGCQPQYFGIEVSHASCNRLIYEMERVVSRKQAEYLCRVLKFYYGQVKEACRRYGMPAIPAFRLSGGMDFRVVREDNGIDIVACYMQHALTGQFGDDFSLLSEPLHGCYATICVGLKNGRINTIKGIDAVRQLPYVYSLFQYYHEGDDMQYSGIFLLVLCRIFVKADNNAEFKQHINTILCMLEVEDENGLSLLLGYPHTLNIN